MRRVVGPLLLCFAVALAAVPAAAAKAPPQGRYDCVIGDNILFGTIVVSGASSYSYRGKAGSFTTGAARKSYPDGTKGYDIRFKGGGLGSKYHGHWYKASGGGPNDYEIALLNPTDGFESIYCEKPR